jgi:hypothetical protein
MANPLQCGDSGVERQREVERDFQKMKVARDAQISATVECVDDVLHFGHPASVKGSLREIDDLEEARIRSSDASDRHPKALSRRMNLTTLTLQWDACCKLSGVRSGRDWCLTRGMFVPPLTVMALLILFQVRWILIHSLDMRFFFRNLEF